MKIEQAGLADITELAVLFDAYRVFYKQESDIAGAERFLSEKISNLQSVIYIAKDAGKAVGFTQLYPIYSSVSMKNAWLLNDLFVDEQERGKGIADLLLKQAALLGAETDCGWLLLKTATDNFRAQHVYERNGWKKDEVFYSYYFRY